MREGVPLLDGRAVPFHGLRLVLLDADTIFIAHAQVVLRLSVPLLGGRAVPFYRFRLILLHAGAVGITHA